MFKINFKKIPKTVFLPDGIPSLDRALSGVPYKVSYRVRGDDIKAEVIFTEKKEVHYFEWTGKYWKFRSKHSMISITTV